MMETLPEIIPVRPVITKDELNFDWNQEEVKAYLKAVTEKYVGLVVTAENLPDMEKARREVVRFRTAITKFKADGKRRLKVPADKFSAQCDELIAVVKDVEEPIAMQLSKYEEERKQKLTESITREYQAKASAMGLDMEHWQLDMDARWFNKTAKWSDTCNAIDEMIRGQIAQQKAIEAAAQLRATKIEYSKASVELANQKYKLETPLAWEEVFPDIEEYGCIGANPLEDVTMEEIKAKADAAGRARCAVEHAARAKEAEVSANAPDEPQEASELNEGEIIHEEPANVTESATRVSAAREEPPSDADLPDTYLDITIHFTAAKAYEKDVRGYLQWLESDLSQRAAFPTITIEEKPRKKFSLD